MIRCWKSPVFCYCVTQYSCRFRQSDARRAKSVRSALAMALTDAADAQLVISFLDVLRDVLVDTYANEIISMHQKLTENDSLDEGQIELPFNDPPGF